MTSSPVTLGSRDTLCLENSDRGHSYEAGLFQGPPSCDPSSMLELNENSIEPPGRRQPFSPVFSISRALEGPCLGGPWICLEKSMKVKVNKAFSCLSAAAISKTACPGVGRVSE